MKIVNLNFNFRDLDDREVEIDGNKVNVGKEVAAILARLNEGDAIKMISWSLDWHKGNSVYMDDSDFKKFKEIIETHKGINNLMKYNILQYLDTVPDSKVEEKSK